MNYKKFLKRPEAGSGQARLNDIVGQAALEYFVLLAVIGAMTLFIGNSFLNRARTSSDSLYSAAVGRILNP